LASFEISFILTDSGVTNYETVLAALYRYIEMLKERISEVNVFEDFDFFKELKVMSEIGFKYFKVTESIDNVCDIANEMLFTKDISKILKDTYPDTCIEEVDMGLLKGLLNGLTLEKSKIVISGKNFVQNESLFGYAADFK
jgi:secreted Zn-dependent insulinase-like peptidase